MLVCCYGTLLAPAVYLVNTIIYISLNTDLKHLKKNNKTLYFFKSFLTAMNIALHTDLGEEGGIKRGWWPNAQKIKVYRVISMPLDTHLTSLWFPVSEKGMKAVRINFMLHWKKKKSSTFIIQPKSLPHVLYLSIQN